MSPATLRRDCWRFRSFLSGLPVSLRRRLLSAAAEGRPVEVEGDPDRGAVVRVWLDRGILMLLPAALLEGGAR